MTSLEILGGQVLAPGGWMQANLAIEDGIILSVERTSPKDDRLAPLGGFRTDKETGDGLGLGSSTELDVSGHLVVPGFIDLQVNGGWGVDLASDPAGLWEVGRRWLPPVSPPGCPP